LLSALTNDSGKSEIYQQKIYEYGVLMNKLFCLICCATLIGLSFASETSTFLNEAVFKNKHAGIFVDIGAYDGIYANNTYFFEQNLGWTGVCVEPLPSAYARLTHNRKCTCRSEAIAKNSGRREFVQVYGPNQFDMLSGFNDTFQAWVTVNHQDMHGAGWRLIMVPTITLNDLCKKNSITHIDYLSINTQGSETEIITSVDFTTVAIDVISVDNPFKIPTIDSRLTAHGYTLIKRFGTCDIYSKI
jgi:FkbM family methyltransferase